MLFLLPIVEFLLLPLAQGVRDEAIKRISAGAVDESQARVSSWLAPFRGAEPTPDRAALRRELATDPALYSELHQALSRLPDMPTLPESRGDMPSDSTELLLDGYAEVLYQFALTAIWLGRPVAIEGFLQGDDWVAVCESQAYEGMLAFRTSGKPVFPDPTTIWERTNMGAERSLKRTYSSDNMRYLEYRVRHTPDEEQRKSEIDELEWRWRVNPTDALPPRSQKNGEPFTDRWHVVTEIRPYVVPLPAAPVRDLGPRPLEPGTTDALRYNTQLLVEKEQPLKHSEYPAQLRPLIELRDGPATIERLRRRLIAIIRADHTLSAEVQAALSVF